MSLVAQRSSVSAPTEAPMNRLNFHFPCRLFFCTWSARAMGTAFGYPAGVKPDQPRFMPGLKNWIVSSADMTFDCSFVHLRRLSSSADMVFLRRRELDRNQ